MQTGSDGPDDDGPDVAFLRSHPVDELPGKEGDEGIENGECGGDETVVGIAPMEIDGDEVFPCEGEHLTVHVVDRGGKEKHRADDPTIVGHFVGCCTHVSVYFNLLFIVH